MAYSELVYHKALFGDQTHRYDSLQEQTAIVTPVTCSRGRGVEPWMKEAGSNPLAVYILCCTPPRDVHAHTNNGEDFPLSAPQKSISLSKLTPSKHQLATPSNTKLFKERKWK
jgi:hypothetical protein